ncbi:MAG: succinate--CoA ligase subunit alpha [Actinobacteria bacterium]|nr:succinate--CoA ligase subunit alpha [Actinomycetota bacterium]
MAVYVDETTRLLVQNLTGREGSFHAMRNRAYGTNVVAGVSPGRGGQELQEVPVFDTVAQAVEATGANTTLCFVPAPFAPDAILEAAAAPGMRLIVCITEGIPAHDEARVVNYLRRTTQMPLVGPNCPGVISPGKANVGIMPHEICLPGDVGVVSRSGTLTYQAVHELTARGIGQSTCVGIGGDPVPGTSFVDVLSRFEADPGTRAVVLIGEIGGEAEEQAAAFIKEQMTKPVVAYIAGFTAPPGKKMGHAGAIISGSSGTAAAKKEALEAAGAVVVTYPTEIGEAVAALR